MNNFIFPKSVEKWDVFEVCAKGFDDQNPFVDYTIKGIFTHDSQTLETFGFYDGNGTYKVRFMPSFEGTYHFKISGTFSNEILEGDFTATAPNCRNHGPVRVANTFHFAFEDGTPYRCVGTTCYAWTHQSQALQEKTLETLKNSPFNKIRFCVFPKYYDYNHNAPITYPYVGTPDRDWDFRQFNPEHFRLFENRIHDLMEMNIQADIIILHPYDKWGFSTMSAECDDLYVNYIVARFSAYRNVWWSLANEYDLMTEKTISDWERIASIICKKDVYHRLRSIHNCKSFYDYTRPWITHCSIQRTDAYKSAELTAEWRQHYQKPVVLDEICYEGNINHGWGNISGQELTRRFWEASLRGGYAGHGETYLHPQDILWWSHGGELHGTSPERIQFLSDILNETPGAGLKLMPGSRWDEVAATADEFLRDSGYYLYYYGFTRPAFKLFHFDDRHRYEVECIDTWNMTIEMLGTFQGQFKITLPGREYMALRIKRI